MELKYVGARPIVSQHGVSFDKTKPDSYTFLNAAVELLEALSFDEVVDKKVYLHNFSGKEYSSRQLVDLLEKHCTDTNEIFASHEEETTEMVEKYTHDVEKNDKLTPDERRAWLGNIAIMRDYYLQYKINENAYKCALKALADEIHNAHIEEVTFSLGRNYGLVVSHLIQVLAEHKPPYDATISFEEKDGNPAGILNMNRPKPLGV